MTRSIGQRLEQYTIKRSHEVLIVTLETEDEQDQIAIYKGFSSSLVRPTSFDPDVPVFPESGEIISIDRVASPYNPDAPNYIQQGLTWEMMRSLLSEVGV